MTYNIDIINLGINHYANNIKISKIASILNISIMNIYLWIKKYNYFFLNNIQLTKEDYYKIKNFKPHRSSKIYLYETQICDYVNNNNGCSLNDIIFNIPNINISKSSICNILKKNKISRKKINNRIIIKNYDELEKIRINFINNISDDFFLNVIAIDESSSL
jgi:transposase